jgi:hypothetical protein
LRGLELWVDGVFSCGSGPFFLNFWFTVLVIKLDELRNGFVLVSDNEGLGGEVLSELQEGNFIDKLTLGLRKGEVQFLVLGTEIVHQSG